MFVTLDVVFHEDSMYFSFELELQGEYQEEVQTLDYDVHISEEGELFKLGKQDASELDLSGITLDQSGDKHSESNDEHLESSDEHLESGVEHSEIEIMASPPSGSLTP